ncbi:MAG: Membrane-fusion proteinEfflux transporter, family, subunit [Alphaproteobacteria bacterium]|nr:Membrane-fusion proteinEfflux transporter, family, subunit [Alphaproteobacteria bacterium]
MSLVRFRHYICRNPITIIVGVVLILLVSRSALFRPSPKPIVPSLPKVMIKHMTAISVPTSIQLNGHTAEARRVTLKAKTSGRILSLLAKKGEKVDAGQDLILIDPEDRPARLAEAKAKLHQRSLERAANTKLEAKAVKSQNALAACIADYESAKSSLALIEQEIADTHIKAPFKGILEETFVETGNVVNVGMDDKVAVIIELDPLKITCDVPEKDISRIKPGKLSAHVTYIAKAADPKTRTYRVETQVKNLDMAIPAGLTARISFPTGNTNGYIISPAAISLKDEERKVVFYPAHIEEARPEGLLVIGLPDQISLVTAGGDFVIEGQQVETSLDPRTDAPGKPS